MVRIASIDNMIFFFLLFVCVDGGRGCGHLAVLIFKKKRSSILAAIY